MSHDKVDAIRELSTKADGDGVQLLCRIDPSALEKEFGKLNTTDVVVTEERLDHIRERHPEDFQLFEQFCEKAIREPDVILKDEKNANTVFMVLQMPETNLNAVVRLSVAGKDDEGKMNSVMTFYRIREKNLKKMMARNKILYIRDPN